MSEREIGCCVETEEEEEEELVDGKGMRKAVISLFLEVTSRLFPVLNFFFKFFVSKDLSFC